MDDPLKLIFDTLYSSTNGYKLSVAARSKLSHVNKAHTYGEVTYEGFKQMLALAKPKENDVFYDLGSGTGKPVFLASLFAPFKKLVGVEVIDSLHEASLNVLTQYENMILHNPSIITYRPHISFIRDDFKKVDFSDADIIYMNATCFDFELANMPFVKKIENLKVGTRIITNSLPILSAYYTSDNIGQFKFSWGYTTVFLQEKYR